MAQEPSDTTYDELVGLTLEGARALLPPDVTILETASPFTGKFSTPIYGAARIVRVRAAGQRPEVVTSREIVGETRLPPPEKRAAKRP